MNRPINIVVAGLGGQGVLRASQILSMAAFKAGHDVKTSEVHGMSQRGGSVYSDVRFGERVDSPMVPAGEADYFVALAADQIEPHRWLTGDKTVVILPDAVDVAKLKSRRSLNVALLGVLSTHLDVEERFFVEAIRDSFKEELRAPNVEAFGVGRGGRKAAG
jgi:indolepyruvate ferredoxin oxidoreductase, beta subunit